MTIAIDAGEMQALRGRLRDAAAEVGGAVPVLPGAAVFGPAVLGAAVASFESAIRREALALHERWAALDDGVQGTLEDLGEVEARNAAEVDRLFGRLV
ncbi:hypothetical protein ACWKWP_15780 [Agromyces soli]